VRQRRGGAGAADDGARGPRSGVVGRREPLQPLDGFEVLLHQVVDDLADGTHAVHLPDDLAHRVEHHVLRLVGIAMTARHRLGRDHELERHTERLRRLGRLPGVRPVVAQHAARLAREGARADRVLARRREIGVALRGRRLGFLHRQPDRPRPHALCAHGKRRGDLTAGPDAASGEDRGGRDRVDHLRPEDDAADVAGVPAALGALRHDDVDAGVTMGARLPRRSAERRHQATGLVDAVDHVRGRRAERVRDQLHLGMAERDVDLRIGGRGSPAEQLVDGLALRQLGHPVLRQHALHEVAVLRGDRRAQHLLELLGVDLAHALVLAGDDDIDAVRPVTHVVVDPLALDLELVGREPDGSQHAQSAGTADGRNDVAAVAEGEDRELDPETVTQIGTHGGLPSPLAQRR